MSEELEQWAEMYGHPEEWVKRAQAAHARAERAEAERDAAVAALDEFREGLTQALNDHGVPAMPSWREAIDWLAANGQAMTLRARSGGSAQGLPVRVKPLLMDLPWPVWKHVVYPLWLRWYKRWCRNERVWKTGSYRPGDSVRWRGVHIVCCTDHFVGDAADHPWDPGWGWVSWKANALWEPATARDRLLLRLIGDPRRAS